MSLYKNEVGKNKQKQGIENKIKRKQLYVVTWLNKN